MRFKSRLVVLLFLFVLVALVSLPAIALNPPFYFDFRNSSGYNARFDGNQGYGYLGLTSGVYNGDVNNDGKNDFLIMAYADDYGGKSDVGSVTILDNTLISSVGPGSNFDLADSAMFSVKIVGGASGDYLGASSPLIVDINGNGINDLIVPAPNADNNSRVNSGSIYIIYDSELAKYTGTGNIIDLSQSAKYSVRIDGATASDFLGRGYMAVGDVNNNGTQDIIVSSDGSDYSFSNAGSVFVIDGGTIATYSGPGENFNLTDNTKYFMRIDGAGASHELGWGSIVAKDIDGNNRIDLLIGADNTSYNGRASSGSVYLILDGIYASFSNYGNVLPLVNSNNFTIRFDGSMAYGYMGYYSVGEPGDLSGDGRADLLIGEPYTASNGRESAGSFYVIYHELIASKLSLVGNTIDLASGSNYNVRYDSSTAFGRLSLFGLAIGNNYFNDGTNAIIVNEYSSFPYSYYPQGDAGWDHGSVFIIPKSYYGSYLGVGNNVDLRDVNNQYIRTAGVTYKCRSHFGNYAFSDLNGDGSIDIATSGYGSDYNGRTDSGSAWIVYNYPHSIGTEATSYVTNNSSLTFNGQVDASNSITKVKGVEFSVDSNSLAGGSGGWQTCSSTTTSDHTEVITDSVMDLGASGDWDDVHTGHDPVIINEGGVYKMWFAGHDGAKWRIGYATSTDGLTWTKYVGNNCVGTVGNGCVIDTGATNNWDDANVYGISVINDGGVYKMWYSGQRGAGSWNVRTGYLTSNDGITWTRYAGNSCSGTTGNGCVFDIGSGGTWDSLHTYYPQVLKDGSTYKMWYYGTSGPYGRMGYATSADGVSWTRYAANSCTGTTGNGCVFDVSSVGNWDDSGIVTGPVTLSGGVYTMYYTGGDGYSNRVGLITSSDGISWTRSTLNNCTGTKGNGCLLAGDYTYSYFVTSKIDYGYAYFPVVINEGGLYRMWFTTYNSRNTRLSYATSTDGVNWTKKTKTITAADTGYDSTYELFSCGATGLTEGVHNIYLRSYDETYSYSALSNYGVLGVTIDLTKPTGSVSVVEDVTSSQNIHLLISADDNLSGVTQMMISNNSSFESASWESYSTTKDWQVTSGDGVKTVYIKYKDQGGNVSDVYSDTVVLDTTGPTDELKINGGARYTNNRQVTLTLLASDANSSVVSMMVSENSSFVGVAWESFVSTKTFTLSAGDGVKNVYVKFKDTAGNVSAVYSSSIVLDTSILTLIPSRLNTLKIIQNILHYYYTTGKKLKISGVTEAFAHVVIEVRSDPVTCETDADANGNFTCEFTSEIPMGYHTIKIAATDLAGNVITYPDLTLGVRVGLAETGSPAGMGVSGGSLILAGLWLIRKRYI